MFFLIEYDRPRGTIVELREFDGFLRKAAEDARLAVELALNNRGIDHEVVLLDAADKEALMRTHSRYFEDLAELARTKIGSDKNNL